MIGHFVSQLIGQLPWPCQVVAGGLLVLTLAVLLTNTLTIKE